MVGLSIRGRDVGGWIAIALVVIAFVPLLLHIARGEAVETKVLSLDAPISDEVPPGVTLVIGDPITQKVLQHNGWLKELRFHVEFAQISGGPGVTEAFHAKALDVGSAANIPPIHSTWVGIPAKIVAFRFRKEPLRYPLYKIGIAPKSDIKSIADLKGKRIAYSPGQAQGAVALRMLFKAGISQKDITLVDLPASADTYIGALAANQVDAAPIGAGLQTNRYLDKYARDGASVISHGAFRDDPGILFVRDETLADPAKAAAIKQYVRLWARAQKWIDDHPREWAQLYYIRDQGLTAEDAALVIRETGLTDIPRNWDDAIAYQQETINFLARETNRKTFDAHQIFDRRFETVAADAIGVQ